MNRQFLQTLLDGTGVVPAPRTKGVDREAIIWGALVLIHGGLFAVLFDLLIRSLT